MRGQVIGQVLRHFKPLVATLKRTLVESYREVALEMLPLLGVFLEYLRAAVDRAFNILCIGVLRLELHQVILLELNFLGLGDD